MSGADSLNPESKLRSAFTLLEVLMALIIFAFAATILAAEIGRAHV